MKSNLHLIGIISVTIALMFLGCEKETIPIVDDHAQKSVKHGLSARGGSGQYFSPYAVVSMREAHDSLTSLSMLSTNTQFSIDTTDVYVSYTINSEGEYQTLVNLDTGAILFPHPLWDYSSKVSVQATT